MALKLFFLILGCKPKDRLTEQHDVFFGVGNNINELLPAIKNSWPDAKLHIDSWRELTSVDGFRLTIVPKQEQTADGNKLFFLNLGGYKPGDMEEYHYKLFCVAANKGEAVTRSKNTAFYRHTGFAGATSHIDDRYGIDVDDIYEIEDILSKEIKEQYSILIEPPVEKIPDDELHIGYVKLSLLEQ
jgi:Domain of Unknown Function (DUF1543)